jgi:hypothetical protein
VTVPVSVPVEVPVFVEVAVAVTVCVKSLIETSVVEKTTVVRLIDVVADVVVAVYVLIHDLAAPDAVVRIIDGSAVIVVVVVLTAVLLVEVTVFVCGFPCTVVVLVTASGGYSSEQKDSAGGYLEMATANAANLPVHVLEGGEVWLSDVDHSCAFRHPSGLGQSRICAAAPLPSKAADAANNKERCSIVYIGHLKIFLMADQKSKLS